MIWANSVVAALFLGSPEQLQACLQVRYKLRVWNRGFLLEGLVKSKKSLAFSGLSTHRVAIGLRPRDQVGQFVFASRRHLGFGRMQARQRILHHCDRMFEEPDFHRRLAMNPCHRGNVGPS